ncbi:MAG: aminoglycoside phosphotransferase family protein [Corynebacterium sp.]|uniref:aminoglycoside phosphotransferase family protein n=1 Tax=Corynebacterium sp. TaxID=1720 RepID=UPI0026DBDF58|nr:aminoglycoside phosphotransferase family protein [Corynebacterium sp.]MDO4762104.1 aminoglycoside phosphotransferase family protein [Corynebacterium sp.]
MIEDNQAVDALQLWGITETPVREHSGLNKHTWKVATGYWLAADTPAAFDLWCTVDEILRQPELKYLELPRAVPTKNGDNLAQFRGYLWRLTTSVEGRQPDPTSVEDLDSVAVGLAQLHAAMAKLPQKFGAHGISTLTVINHARDLVSKGLLPFNKKETETILAGVSLFEQADTTDEHYQLIHGDPSYPNLRLAKTGELNGIIDWEGVRWDSPLHDLAVVGQTVLYRSGWVDRKAGLQRLLDTYANAGGHKFSVHQLLVSILSIKFGSIAHHGQKLLDGRGDRELVRSQAEKIAIVCRLLSQ